MAEIPEHPIPPGSFQSASGSEEERSNPPGHGSPARLNVHSTYLILCMWSGAILQKGSASEHPATM